MSRFIRLSILFVAGVGLLVPALARAAADHTPTPLEILSSAQTNLQSEKPDQARSELESLAGRLDIEATPANKEFSRQVRYIALSLSTGDLEGAKSQLEALIEETRSREGDPAKTMASITSRGGPSGGGRSGGGSSGMGRSGGGSSGGGRSGGGHSGNVGRSGGGFSGGGRSGGGHSGNVGRSGGGFSGGGRSGGGYSGNVGRSGGGFSGGGRAGGGYSGNVGRSGGGFSGGGRAGGGYSGNVGRAGVGRSGGNAGNVGRAGVGRSGGNAGNVGRAGVGRSGGNHGNVGRAGVGRSGGNHAGRYNGNRGNHYRNGFRGGHYYSRHRWPRQPRWWRAIRYPVFVEMWMSSYAHGYNYGYQLGRFDGWNNLPFNTSVDPSYLLRSFEFQQGLTAGYSVGFTQGQSGR